MPNDQITEAEIEAAWQTYCAAPIFRNKDGWRAVMRAALLAAARVRPVRKRDSADILGMSFDALADQCEKAEARAEKAEAERDAAKSILSKCADAIGNGAVVAPECSLEFMAHIPSEIGLHVASLTEDLGETREQRDVARAQADVLAVHLKAARKHLNALAGHAAYSMPQRSIRQIDEVLAAYDTGAATSSDAAGARIEETDTGGNFWQYHEATPRPAHAGGTGGSKAPTPDSASAAGARAPEGFDAAARAALRRSVSYVRNQKLTRRGSEITRRYVDTTEVPSDDSHQS